MAKIKKLVLVTSDGHPQHKYFMSVANALKDKLHVDLEIRKDDYVYLTNYGATDELGLTWLPQLLAELDNGEVVKVLTEPKLTPKGQLDLEGGIKEALQRIGEYVNE
jgi:hypothetical protein